MPGPVLTDQSVIQYGLLVMHAMDYHRARKAPPGAFVAAADPPGGSVVGYLHGTDTVVPGHPAFQAGPLKFLARNTCYGLVIQRPNEMVIAIRGTDGFEEWVEDVEAAYQNYPTPDNTAAHVEQGFWGIYHSLSFVNPDGTREVAPPAQVIKQKFGDFSSIVVAGHSLGSPIATYLTLDLARIGLGEKVSGCYFASPNPGDLAFATYFQKMVGNYVVYNYYRDLVPQLPPFGYSALSNVRIITPNSAQAKVEDSPGGNHHIVCYLATLDYHQTVMELALFNPPQPVPNMEAGSWACVLGPA